MRTFAFFLSIILSCFAVSAADNTNQTAVITAKPRFEQQELFIEQQELFIEQQELFIEQQEQFKFIVLIISDTNRSFDIGWGMLPDLQFIPVSLDTNQVYTFTVAQKSRQVRNHTYTSPELRKVQSGDQTIYDIEVCEVHKSKMDYKAVRISYGLKAQRPDEPSSDTERRLFPHRREYSDGGCVISSDSPKTNNVYVCSDCKKAYEKWKSENNNTK